MTSILALDLSKKNTGWGLWSEGMDKPRYGSWKLGTEYTGPGQTQHKLIRNMTDLRQLDKFTSLYWEEPLTQMQRMGHSNKGNDIQVKLVGQCEVFAYVCRVRTQEINQTSWRRHFVGKMPRGTKSKDWKQYAIERCQQYGWRPRGDDEADALGLLDYAISLEGLTPPWRQNEVLRPMLVGGTK